MPPETTTDNVPPTVDQTVILAAGSGRRLAGSGPDLPKPLRQVAGQPLLAHALGQAASAGCTDAVVVVKHEAHLIEAFLGGFSTRLRIRTVHNPADGPNGSSLLAARHLAEDRFFLQMADHVFISPVLERLGRLESPRLGVLVDPRPRHIDLSDATKVRLADEHIVAIGKQLEPWDAVDAGCFVLSPAVFDALEAVEPTEPLTVSSGIRRLAAQRMMDAVDLGGVTWMDVDTPADQELAERLFAGQAVPSI
jgi:1L-myo-inositol 1-phosphate cytidylyltransferase